FKRLIISCTKLQLIAFAEGRSFDQCKIQVVQRRPREKTVSRSADGAESIEIKRGHVKSRIDGLTLRLPDATRFRGTYGCPRIECTNRCDKIWPVRGIETIETSLQGIVIATVFEENRIAALIGVDAPNLPTID